MYKVTVPSGRNPVDRSQTVEPNPLKIKTVPDMRGALERARDAGVLNTVVDKAGWTMTAALRFMTGQDRLPNGMFGRMRQALKAEM